MKQRFGRQCCLHLHFTLKMAAAMTSEAIVSYHNTTLRYNADDLDLNFHRSENHKSRDVSEGHDASIFTSS
jgi:hypothetical protein